MLKKALKRALTATFLGIAAILILRLTVEFIVASGHLSGVINRLTQDVQIQYASASGSLSDGFLFRELEVVGNDSQVRWRIFFKTVKLAPSLTPLLTKTFESALVHAQGVRFEIDFKKKAGRTLSDPNDYKNNWRIRLGDIRLEGIDHLRFGESAFTFTQGASLRSWFYFWPEHELEIQPSLFEAHESGFHLKAKFKLERATLRELPGAAILRKADLSLVFNGETSDLRLANSYFRLEPWFEIYGGKAHWDCAIAIKNGLLGNESSARLQADRLSLKLGPLNVSGSSSLVLVGPRLEILFDQYKTSPIRIAGKRLALSTRMSKTDFVVPPEDIYFSLSSPDGKFSMRLGNSLIESRIHVSAHLARNQPEQHQAEFDQLEFTFSDLSLESHLPYPTARQSRWRGTLSIKPARINWASGQEALFGQVRLEAIDGKPILTMLKDMALLPFDLGTVSSLRNLRASAGLNFHAGLFDVKNLAIRSSTLQADGSFRLEGTKKSGFIKIRHPLKNIEVNFK